MPDPILEEIGLRTPGNVRPPGDVGPSVGDLRQVTLPDGTVVTLAYKEYSDGKGGVIGRWEPSHYTTPRAPREPREPATLSPNTAATIAAQRERDEAARRDRADERDYRDRQDQLNREDQRLARLEREAARQAAEARDKRDFEASEHWRQRAEDYRAQRDKVGDDRDALDRDFRERQFQSQAGLSRAGLTGFLDGTPTLSREEFELRRRESEERRANEPGNFFNYAFRSRGQEPPPLPGTTLQAPQAQAQPRPWWENYSLERLERFPDEELAALPPEVLSQFRNEFLLKRPALLALLPRERVQGEGRYQGTGFANDVIARLGQGAPTVPFPKASGSSNIRPPGGREPTLVDFSDNTGAIQAPQAASATTGLQAPRAAVPTEADAIAVAEAIRKRNQGGF